ncbi:MAG: DUF1566 domain-containing protein, partial [Leptospiraceae bacterium]|nr:DUF1566 domain-containing protein [Leptospiraceae bacterium]
ITSCSSSPALPVGLTISPTDCSISGTPTEIKGKTLYTITATNTAGSDTDLLYITVYAPIKIPDTGLSNCYDNSSVIPCGDSTFPRQDADYADTPYARSYNLPTTNPGYSADSFTKDNTSGLIWKTCSEGLTGANCLGDAWMVRYYGSEAGPTCNALNNANSGAGFAGLTTWRLPTIRELEYLFQYTDSDYHLDLGLFPNWGNAYPYFWSATENTQWSPLQRYYIAQDSGHVSFNYQSNRHSIRCVAGPPAVDATPLLEDQSDGSVFDYRSGLLWQKCSAGQAGTNCETGTANTLSWGAALRYCRDLTLAGKQWRLPNLTELMSIVERNRGAGAYAIFINDSVFPGSQQSYYWSSTTDGHIINYANAVYFGGPGSWGGMVKTGMQYVRCVTGP